MVPLPTPPGPETTMISGSVSRVDRAVSASAVRRGPAPDGCRRCSTSSMILRALTLPTPGSDSSSDTTLSLPTLVSSDASASERLIEPIFRRALISARAARASAALARAAVRCSGVNGGGVAMRSRYARRSASVPRMPCSCIQLGQLALDIRGAPTGRRTRRCRPAPLTPRRAAARRRPTPTPRRRRR